MKIIIIEGPDCTGKNTLISHITELYESTTIIHCQKPRTSDPEEQNRLFRRQVYDIITNKYQTTALIFNRSFIGEYVYGTMYRNRETIETLNFINFLEDTLNMFIAPEDLIYIQLLSSSPKLLVKNDDNKSLSQGDIDKIQNEIDLFYEVFNESHIKNKKLIYVNNGDTFRNIDDITNEALTFMKQ